MRNFPVVRHRLMPSLSLFVLLLLPSLAIPQKDDDTSRAWNQPVKPFRIIGNIYYVGATEVSSFLIVTPAGHILLDSGFAETVPQIKANIAQLGFKLEDVKILINSHAHYDHAGGLADLKELTGAKLAASEADAAALAVGDRDDFQWGDRFAFKPVKTDRILHDEDTIELGGVTLTAHLTPGHTRGCTTWTMKVEDHGKQLAVLFTGSTTIPGYKLLDNAKYPNIVADYAHTFAVLKTLKCDVFLGPHGSFFGMLDKRERLEKGEQPNPFIDPRNYQEVIARTAKAYHDQLKKEQQAKHSK